MRRNSLFIYSVILAVVYLFIGTALACEITESQFEPKDRMAYQLGKLAGKVGLANLKLKNLKPGELLVITNAGNCRFNNDSTMAAIEGISWATDTSPGKGNLLRISSTRNANPWFFIFHRPSGEGVFLEAPTMAKGELTSQIFKVKKENIAAKRLLEDPTTWDNKVKERIFQGREFTIVTFANQWAAGAPYDLLRTGEFHDHVCPGVTMGYMIAAYLERHLPLGQGDRYYFISTAPNCHDDALQVLFNATSGKKFFTTLPMTEAQKTLMPSRWKNLTGIYVVYNERAQTGRAIALTFDWDLLQTKREGIGWAWRLRMNQELLGLLDKPEKFLSKVHEFELPAGVAPADLLQADNKTLRDIGFIEK
ncbi:MAG: FmdE family protein [Smithellaceae bacterium]|nr:FmdE family protein [Smithellaceae bacterium]